MNLNAKELSLVAMRQSDLLREAEQRRLVREATHAVETRRRAPKNAPHIEVDALSVRLSSAT